MRRGLVLGLLLLVAAGCGGGEEEETYTISDQVLQGNVLGQSWQFVSGYADDGFEEGEMWIHLYAVEAEGGDPCAPSAYAPEERVVGLMVIPEPQETEFSFENAGTASYFEDGTIYVDILVSGRLVIEEVSADTISGAMVGSSPDSEVDGHFSVPICPQD